MKKTKLLLIAVVLAGFTAGTTSIRAQDNKMGNMPGMDMGGQTASTNTPDAKVKVKPYPLDYCIVSGDKFDGDMGKPIVMVYQGQEMKFCCASCPKKFKKDPEKYLKLMDEAVKKAAIRKK